jgi:queuine tRNA-ribosyltransferase
MFEFRITATDGEARTGEFVTPHGTVQTPMFMPVGTHGAVKGVSPAELKEIGSQTVLANTYHMYLRPGDETVKNVGGLHAFTQYDGPMLTDSGGFQVFSLGERGISGIEKNPLRTVSENGITFKSHLDGSKHLFTPERSIEIQQNLGADVIMAFDQPVYGMSDEKTTAEAVDRTHRWLDRSIEQWKTGDTSKQALFGIVQGGTHKGLHTKSAEFVVSRDLPGNAIGGLAVGESKEAMWEATSSITAQLPAHKPRYFMGLGDPTDIIDATLRGLDMYDCVAPSRIARHGAVWMLVGDPETEAAFWAGDTQRLLSGSLQVQHWNLNNARFKDDARPLVEVPTTLPQSLQGFSRATLNHYTKENEMLGYRIMTLHNIAVLHVITVHMRQAILLGRMRELRELFKRA